MPPCKTCLSRWRTCKPNVVDNITNQRTHFVAREMIFPTFNGEDMDGWLYKVKHYFMFHNIPNEQRIHMATLKMEGVALKWLLWIDKDGNLMSWSDFMVDVLKRFGQNEVLVSVGRLNKLVHTELVKDYQSCLELMTTKVHGMSKNIMKEIYIAWLSPVIQKEVIKAKLVDINEAFILASICEDTDEAPFKKKQGFVPSKLIGD